MLAEQDSALGTASEKFRQGKQDMKFLKVEAEETIKLLNQQIKEYVVYEQCRFTKY